MCRSYNDTYFDNKPTLRMKFAGFALVLFISLLMWVAIIFIVSFLTGCQSITTYNYTYVQDSNGTTVSTPTAQVKPITQDFGRGLTASGLPGL